MKILMVVALVSISPLLSVLRLYLSHICRPSSSYLVGKVLLHVYDSHIR